MRSSEAIQEQGQRSNGTTPDSMSYPAYRSQPPTNTRSTTKNDHSATHWYRSSVTCPPSPRLRISKSPDVRFRGLRPPPPDHAASRPSSALPGRDQTAPTPSREPGRRDAERTETTLRRKAILTTQSDRRSGKSINLSCHSYTFCDNPLQGEAGDPRHRGRPRRTPREEDRDGGRPLSRGRQGTGSGNLAGSRSGSTGAAPRSVHGMITVEGTRRARFQ